jgi:biotin synthase-like enzyme
VFGPYAQNDAYGSRAINPMELYHNQVTRTQGVFSLRMFHRSWGLMLIQSNLSAPTTLLDFPGLERFADELREREYDVVGISAIWPNLVKVTKMCALVREHLPQAVIVVGGHIANAADVRQRTGADYVVRGDGVSWFRRFLGEDDTAPIRHPMIQSGHGARTMGVPLSSRSAKTAATLIPSVGCPMGCSFCSTSAMFGGKGRFLNFLETGDELFAVMCRLERAMRVQSFFVMDENFLLYRQRALRLLELMRSHGKSWALYVFSSANALRQYTVKQLVALGVSWVWIGLEGENSDYPKLRQTNTRALVARLQSHGIRTLGSSIIGLPEHTPQTVDGAIDHAIAHDTDFHQFMLYTPVPGTVLHAEHSRLGSLLSEAECNAADSHGQLRFNFHHPHIRNGEETALLLRAFERDFEVNGPSVLRIARTLLAGWIRYKNHQERRVRSRYRRECSGLQTTWAGALWAAETWLSDRTQLVARLRGVRRAIENEFGLTARIAGPLVGRVILDRMRREVRRLERGWTYEPPTFYEVNPAEASRRREEHPSSRFRRCRWVSAVCTDGAGRWEAKPA